MLAAGSARLVPLLWLLLGHPLPEGIFDRAFQVVVQPDRVEIVYEITGNEETLRAEVVSLTDGAVQPQSRIEIFERYGETMLPRVGKNLQVTVNGRPQPVRAVKSEMIPGRHHSRVELTYEVPLTADGTPVELLVTDDNFAETPGFHRQALKGRGGVVVVKSTDKVDLVRVPHVSVSEMTDAERQAMREVRATVELPQPPRETRTAPPAPTVTARKPTPPEPESSGSGLLVGASLAMLLGALGWGTLRLARRPG